MTDRSSFSVVVRRRVSLMGRRLDADGRAVAGGSVTATPVAGAACGSALQADILRADGHYGFLDLPKGDYRVEGLTAAGAAFAATTVTVKGDIGDRNRPIAAADLAVEGPASGQRNKDTPAAGVAGGGSVQKT